LAELVRAGFHPMRGRPDHPVRLGIVG
jgi:hypothetical protein